MPTLRTFVSLSMALVVMVLALAACDQDSQRVADGPVVTVYKSPT